MTEVIILGSGTCVPSVRRAGPAACLKTEGATILVDSASGTLRQMVQAGIPFDSLDVILYTHLHPDHVGELVPLLFASKYSPAYHRKKPVAIRAGSGFLDFFSCLKQAFGRWVEPEPCSILMEELPAGIASATKIPPVVVRAAPTRHTPQSLGYRIETPDGKTAVFSGDTDYCEELVELARGTDIFVCECAAPEGYKIEGHLTPSEAGKMARDADAGRLLLTHFYPNCDEHDLITPCSRYYDGPILLAEDFMRIVL